MQGIGGEAGATVKAAKTTPLNAGQREQAAGIVTGEDTIAAVRAQTSDVMVSFSRGKDSIATWLAVADRFARMVPYTYYFVPDLEFVEDSLAYYEKMMGCHIVRYPAPAFYRMTRNLMYQSPDRIALIDRMDLPEIDHNTLQLALMADAGLGPLAHNAIGLRSKDSVQRAFTISRNGTINAARQIFYPIHDWSKQDVIDAIKRAGWRLPVDYLYFASSFDGLYINYLYPIKLFFPRDYQKILAMFPFAEMEVLRYEAAVARGEQPPYVRPKRGLYGGLDATGGAIELPFPPPSPPKATP